jgi:hypothetical protein
MKMKHERIQKLQKTLLHFIRQKCKMDDVYNCHNDDHYWTLYLVHLNQFGGGRGGKRNFLFFSLVPNVFSWGS